MRPVLETLLCRRYPDLFRQTELPMTETCMCWGFTHHDGWFAIIDALAETISEIDPEAEATQVKEKFGTLRFYCDATSDPADEAITAAEHFSGRVCEESGALGRMTVSGGWVRTMSAEKIARLQAQPGLEHRKPEPETVADLDEGDGRLQLRLEERLQLTPATAIESLTRRHPGAFARTRVLHFPPRFYDLLDVALRLICDPKSRHKLPDRIGIDRVSWNRLDGLLIVPSFISIRRYAEAVVAAQVAAQAAAADSMADADALTPNPAADAGMDNDADSHTGDTAQAEPRATAKTAAGINAAITDALRGIGFAVDESSEASSAALDATYLDPKAGTASPDMAGAEPGAASADPEPNAAGATGPDAGASNPEMAGAARPLSADPSGPDGSAAAQDGYSVDPDNATADQRERAAKLAKELAGRILAVTSFVTAMSLRMDPETGSCGPVDAQGRLIMPEPAGPQAPDLLDRTRQVGAILSQFDRGMDYRPHVFCKALIKPSLEVREHVARSIRAGTTKVLLPHIYSRPSRNFPIPGFDQARHQIAFALAEQHGWHIALPVEMGQFFMGRRSRPTTGRIDRFVYDQASERRFDIDPPFTLLPARDHRIFELNPASQAVFQHIQLHAEATDEALLDDAHFAASSWLANPVLKTGLAQDLNAGRLKGKEAFLAHAILWTAQALPMAQDHAPGSFDPAAHEADAARIYGWAIETDHDGELYLRANHIENHPEIKSQNGLGRSTAIVWYDLTIGWARTRSRYYKLIGEPRR